MTHCYINGIALSDLDLECLTTLGKIGELKLSAFCFQMADKRMEEKATSKDTGTASHKKPTSSPQTIRNVLTKVEKENLIVKSGKGRKMISLNPDLKIQTTGNILLNYKMVYVTPKES